MYRWCRRFLSWEMVGQLSTLVASPAGVVARDDLSSARAEVESEAMGPSDSWCWVCPSGGLSGAAGWDACLHSCGLVFRDRRMKKAEVGGGAPTVGLPEEAFGASAPDGFVVSCFVSVSAKVIVRKEGQKDALATVSKAHTTLVDYDIMYPTGNTEQATPAHQLRDMRVGFVEGVGFVEALPLFLAFVERRLGVGWVCRGAR